jgi:hypothetical protein
VRRGIGEAAAQQRTQRKERTSRIDTKRFVPCLGGDFSERRTPVRRRDHGAGTGHQHTYLAEPRLHVRECPLDRGFVGHVHQERRGVAVGLRHRKPVGSERTGACGADAAGSAGDEGYAAHRPDGWEEDVMSRCTRNCAGGRISAAWSRRRNTTSAGRKRPVTSKHTA